MFVNGEKPSYNVQCYIQKKKNNVTLCNSVSQPDKFRLRQRKTEYIADKLVERLSAPQWRGFFLKAAWRLSEDAIWSTLENTEKKFATREVKKPLNYFIAACNRQMEGGNLQS